MYVCMYVLASVVTLLDLCVCLEIQRTLSFSLSLSPCVCILYVCISKPERKRENPVPRFMCVLFLLRFY